MDDSRVSGRYGHYLVGQMAPVMRALLLTATVGYAVFLASGELLGVTHMALWLRALPLPSLALVAILSLGSDSGRSLSNIGLICLLLLEIGIGMNGWDSVAGINWSLPAYLLLPLASSTVWLSRWDFVLAMMLCMLGPVPVLLHVPHAPLLAYAVYMSLALAISIVLHVFIARILHDHYRMESRLREIAYTDHLTGVANRVRFLQVAAKMLSTAEDNGRPLSALYLDVDHFKTLNDQHGHAMGDRALSDIAQMLATCVRERDLLGRIGGEEFAILLPGLEMPHARRVAERICQAMHALEHPAGHMTISIGVAQHRPGETLDTLLAAADQGLRRAKRNGRDRVESTRGAVFNSA